MTDETELTCRKCGAVFRPRGGTGSLQSDDRSALGQFLHHIAREHDADVGDAADLLGGDSLQVAQILRGRPSGARVLRPVVQGAPETIRLKPKPGDGLDPCDRHREG